MQYTQLIQPIVKWPGGKAGELDKILPLIPQNMNRYFEPFLGGGAVFFSIPSNIHAFVNDKSHDLMQLYRNIAVQDESFFQFLVLIDRNWRILQDLVEQSRTQLLSMYDAYRRNGSAQMSLSLKVTHFIQLHGMTFRGMFPGEYNYDVEHFIKTVEKGMADKISRMRRLEIRQGILKPDDVLGNIEGALKAALYTHLRHLYNNPKKYRVRDEHHTAIFYFIRENAYASMFRFNKDGKFNIPYGGMSYNRKDMGIKIARMRDDLLMERLRCSTLEEMDFFDFLEKYQPQEGDFIFLDPPYDSEFSSYDQNSFGREDHERLAQYLIQCPARFILVIQSTDFILSLYNDKSLCISLFDKTYMYTVKERNNREAVHLMITNYKVE